MAFSSFPSLIAGFPLQEPSSYPWIGALIVFCAGLGYVLDGAGRLRRHWNQERGDASQQGYKLQSMA
jgi:hypothetical protein